VAIQGSTAYLTGAAAQNRNNAMEWTKRKAAHTQQVAGAADQRMKIGALIAKKGFEALLGGAQSAMEPTCAISGRAQADGKPKCVPPAVQCSAVQCSAVA
jgi:hypothetical protein